MMKSLAVGGTLALMLSLASVASAVVNAPVNIAYPIDGSSNDNYVKFAFSVTCPGGQNTVKWAFDGATFGASTYYDNFNAQFLHKLPNGWHKFEVATDCGNDVVKFFVN